MLTPEIIAKIRDLEVAARRASAGLISGNNRTKKRGSGFEFDSLRDYTQGDDMRYIDWKSTARAQKILTRQYLEDRQKTVILLVDVSRSTDFGSKKILKSEFIQQLAGILAFIALFQKDAVGLVLFSDHVERVIKPGKGRSHVLKIVNTLFAHQANGAKTDINKTVQAVLAMQKRESSILLISDLCDKLDANLIAASNTRHELSAFRCVDPVEFDLFPSVGMLTVHDRETRMQVTINTDLLDIHRTAMWQEQDAMWKKIGVPYMTCQTHLPVVSQIRPFLKKFIRK